MPLTKKRKNQLWYGYVLGMVVFYELAMIVLGFTVSGFIVAFAGIAVITFAFVVLMRRLSRPAARPAAGSGPDASGTAAATDYSATSPAVPAPQPPQR